MIEFDRTLHHSFDRVAIEPVSHGTESRTRPTASVA